MFIDLIDFSLLLLQLKILDHPDGAADRGRAVREGGGGQLRADRGRGGRLHAGNHRGRQIHSPTGFERLMRR